MGLTTTSRGGCGLRDNPNICAFPSIWGDDGDDAETESEGPKPTPTSNCVVSDTSTSGCAFTYESDKDGEGGAACKDVYLEFVDELGVLEIVARVRLPAFIVADASSIGLGNPTKVGVRAGMDGSTASVGIHSAEVSFRVVVVVIDGGHAFTRLVDASLDAEQGNMS